MDNSIYEVERDDYVGFVDQIKPECRIVEKLDAEDGFKVLKIHGAISKKHLCSRFINDDTGEEYYYIFEMPADEERRPPIPKRKILLETKEEVQAFFDILSKIQKGEINDDRTISDCQ